MGVIYYHLNHTEDRLMMRIIEPVKFLILTVYSQCILGQIVGSDTEEIHFLCQIIADDHRSRSLDHNALFHIILVWCAFCLQLFFYLFDDLFNLPHFFYRSDHRVHDRDIAIYRSPEKRSQLGLKDFRLGQADTDSSVSQSRIVFLSQSQIICLFISADVQCTDDHLFAGHCLGYLFVNLKLLFLAWKFISAYIQELTSEQADTSGIIFQNVSHVSHTADIGVNIDLVSAFCNVLFPF